LKTIFLVLRWEVPNANLYIFDVKTIKAGESKSWNLNKSKKDQNKMLLSSLLKMGTCLYCLTFEIYKMAIFTIMVRMFFRP
jgi:hypothetical protein